MNKTHRAQEIQAADPKNPKHVAIIMDGNGRWANQRHLPRTEGHRHGVERIRETIRTCSELKIPHLTLYAFSKENWSRPKDEVNFLMKLLGYYLDNELKEMQKSKIRFRMIGRMEELPVEIQKKIKRNIENTKDNTGLNLTLALSYSSRSEIIDTVKKIAQKIKDGELAIDEVDEKLFSDSLFTGGIPDPDLLIRTSGELRLSNFMLWQSSYTEIYVTEKLWPEFSKEEFLKALEAYKMRERRFGNATDAFPEPSARQHEKIKVGMHG